MRRGGRDLPVRRDVSVLVAAGRGARAEFSYAVSSGNELDLDVADYLSFLADDPATRVIASMLEGIRRPEAFKAAAAKALDAGKPVVVVKLGASEAGRHAAASYTGSIAGDERWFG